MALTVTQRPSITSPFTSTWNAVGNPILYKMVRKDYNITAVANSAGALQITVNTNLVTLSTALGGPVLVGATMWVATDNGIYNALYTVVSVTNAANSVVVFSAGTYISPATTGYINLSQRLNYKVSVGVYTSSLIGTIRVSPDKTGLVTIDISKVLWSAMSPDISADLTTGIPSYTDSNVYKNFYIKYTEQWIGSANVETNDSANTFNAVYGALQIPSLYGGNMLEYRKETGTTFTTVAPNWIAAGWVDQGGGGIAWTINASYIEVALGAGQSSNRVRRPTTLLAYVEYTLSGNVNTAGFGTGQLKVTLSTGQEFFGNISLMTETYIVGTIIPNADCTYFDMSILNETVPGSSYNFDTMLMIESTLKTLTKFEEFRIFRGWPFLVSYLDTSSVLLVDLKYQMPSQVLDEYDVSFATGMVPIKTTVLEPCDNSVLLVARNTLGGGLSWPFFYNQEYTFTYDNGVKRKRLRLFSENLTINQWESLEDFVTLGEVYNNSIVEFSSSVIKTQSRIGSQAYVIDSEGNKTGVIVIPNANTTNTRQERHIFTIDIEYPDTFTT